MEFAARRRVRINGTLTRRSRGGLTVEVEQAYGNCSQYIQQRTLIPPGNDRQALERPHYDVVLSDEDASQNQGGGHVLPRHDAPRPGK